MTPVAHTAMALLGLNKVDRKKNAVTFFSLLLLANLPDIDFLLFSRHQYYTHNIFFALIGALLFFPIFKTSKERIILLGISFSHLFLDLLVIDRVSPIGIPLFYPLSQNFFNIGIFPNFQRGSMVEMLSLHNVFTLALENLVFLIPILIIYRKDFRSYFKNKE